MKHLLQKLRTNKKLRNVFTTTDGISFLVNPIGIDEVWNDHNGDIFNLYEVIQNRYTFQIFKDLCATTLYSDEQFNTSKRRSELPMDYFGPSSVPIAWDYFVALSMSVDGNSDVFQSTCDNIKELMNPNAFRWLQTIKNLDMVHRRLQVVELKRMSYVDFIQSNTEDNVTFFANCPKDVNIEKVLDSLEQSGLDYVLLTEEDIKSNHGSEQITVNPFKFLNKHGLESKKNIISNF